MPQSIEHTAEKQPTVAPEGTKVTKIPGVQLSADPGKEVVVRIPGVEQSYRGTIVGYSPYDYLITSVRLPSSVRKELKYGGQVIIKYIHKGTVYGFKAGVLNAITSPASLIFFEYPDIIEKIDLRRASRHGCRIDGALHTLEGDDIECIIINVSESGCKLSARATTRDSLQKTKVDDTMVVTFNLGAQASLKLPVAIRNTSIKKGIITLGCMFLDIRKDEIDAIHEYLDKISRLTR